MGRIHRHLMDCPFMFSVSLKFSKSKKKHWRGKDSLRRSQMILPNFSGLFCDGRWGPLLSCCLTLCDPMDYSMPALSVLHHLPKFAQVHVQCIGDTIHPSHPLSPFSPSALKSLPASGTLPVSQLFISDDENTGVSTSASVLSRSIQGWFPLRLTGLISFLSKGLSGVFSSTIVQRYQFFGALTIQAFVGNVCFSSYCLGLS